MSWVLDLDGVVWLADEPIPGAAEAVARLRAAGEHVVFCTNNSSETVAAQHDKLGRMGIDADDAIVTSAQAAVRLIEPGERVLVCAGAGVWEAVEARGAEPVRDGVADVVIVGMHRDFDYQRLHAASAAVLEGARLVATNDDRTYPTPTGPVPGAGALAAAVAYVAGVTPVVAGKPHAPMVELVRSIAGDEGTMVGDRPETDGAFARALGYRFALVLTGVTVDGTERIDPPPDIVAASLGALV